MKNKIHVRWFSNRLPYLRQGEFRSLIAGWMALLLACAPGHAELVAYWSLDGNDLSERLEEKTGQTALNAFDSGSNASFWNTRSGGFEDVLANGSDATRYLAVPNAPRIQFEDQDFSASLWVYRTAGDGSVAGILDHLSGTGTGWQLLFQANNTLRLCIDDNVGNSVLVDSTDSAYAVNQWIHLAFTVDRSGQRARLFVDASEVTPAGGVDISALTGTINGDQELFIGSLNGTTAPYGRLDDVALSDHVLTANELAELNANGGAPVSLTSLGIESAPPVVLLPEPGVYRQDIDVSLTTDHPDAVIRFTLDGSLPNASSPVYTPPLILPTSATVRARAYLPSGQEGPVSQSSYYRFGTTLPNIVVIVADDLGFNDIGSYGAVSLATPHLDALAYTGQRFTQFTTCGPGDLASQYALLTGRLARRSGLPESIGSGALGIDTREWTLAEALRKQGYTTAFLGSWHLGDTPGSRPLDQGFTTTNSVSTSLTDLTTAARTLMADSQARPYFLHFQPDVGTPTGGSLLGEYGNRIEALDGAVGELLDTLETEGLTDNTLVLLLSDGGANVNTGSFPSGSNGDLKDGAGSTWEGGVHVPLIVHWPSVVLPGTNYATLWLPDLYASLAHVAGAYLPADRPIDGRARADILLGGRSRPDEDSTLFLHQHDGVDYALHAIRKGRWKLHLAYTNTDPENTTSATAPLLYNLLTDPSEHVNRASAQVGVRTDLSAAAATHEASFLPTVSQLPPKKPPVYGNIVGAVSPIIPGPGVIHYAFSRPADSLNDSYSIEHADDVNGPWSPLPITPFLHSALIENDGTESVLLDVPLDHPAFTPPRHYLRLRAHRP